MQTIEPYNSSDKQTQYFRKWAEQVRRVFRKVPSFPTGTGSPEGVLNGELSDMYIRTDGTSTTTLYVKTTNGGNTGWQAIG